MKIVWAVSALFLLVSCKKELTQKQLEKDFATEYCDCLSKQSDKTPEQLIGEETIKCVEDFFKKREKDEAAFRALIATKGYDASLSEFDKGKLFGREIVVNAAEDLVNNCDIYVKSLNTIKDNMKKQILAQGGENAIATAIENLKTMESSIVSMGKTDQSNYYLSLGILHEFLNDTKQAVVFYEKSLAADPTTEARAYKMLLEKK